MRFLADMGVSISVVEWLQAQGHDAKHLREEGLHKLADGEVFSKAITEQRIVLTFDLDFGEIVAASQGRVVSVILFRLQNPRNENVIACLEPVLAKSIDALSEGAIVVVEDFRHRIRRLPIGK